MGLGHRCRGEAFGPGSLGFYWSRAANASPLPRRRAVSQCWWFDLGALPFSCFCRKAREIMKRHTFRKGRMPEQDKRPPQRTRQKKAEAMFRGFFDAVPDAMILVDQRGDIILANK